MIPTHCMRCGAPVVDQEHHGPCVACRVELREWAQRQGELTKEAHAAALARKNEGYE